MHWVPQLRNIASTKEGRLAYVQATVAEDPNARYVFFDETGYCLWARRSKARSHRGQPAHVVSPVSKHDVVNVLGAVSPGAGWVLHQAVNGDQVQ